MSPSMLGTMEMGRPPNTIGSAWRGPFDEIDAVGMFSVVKVRKDIVSYNDPRWYQHPEGPVTGPVVL